ncbi:Ulp1 protease family C-terminal catalytic domain [Arabidopsis thaliana x Arabidopsis arenosa]|uniref:Ulp1 protease family C-terminal catalytic domain n=1 Tax=Arabidopsis thaliana x Arabidopsis arenosa TaxID=1240361 RepID=A0A8T1XQQ8_9BRAS|nr:Ulp1 protease family C-terminal catalytic domain [Arabidopsis thaliana x Arabidopsis arenosa]
MGTTSGDDKILSYEDVVLRRSDLDILNGPNFLNDRVIEFYLSFLSTVHSSPTISLIPPSIAFWISNCPDTEYLKDFMKPLNLRDKDLLIFPVNDNSNVEVAEGGLHWSLLVYYKEANTFVHHDSFMGVNKWSAKQLFKAVSPFVSNGDASYKECTDTPQQKNGYDCGVFLLAIARVICEWFSAGGMKNRDELWFTNVKETVPDLVNHLREEILGLIKRLMSEGVSK